jgi:hypothetical protein
MRLHRKRFLADRATAPSVIELAETLYKIPTLLTTWTRCGKPKCRCTVGQLHGPYHALYWREGSIQRRRYVRAIDVPVVRAILLQRRAERRAERQAFALALGSWRELTNWIAEVEAILGGERPNL